MILEPNKIKSATVSTVSPSICHEVMGPDDLDFGRVQIGHHRSQNSAAVSKNKCWKLYGYKLFEYHLWHYQDSWLLVPCDLRWNLAKILYKLHSIEKTTWSPLGTNIIGGILDKSLSMSLLHVLRKHYPGKTQFYNSTVCVTLGKQLI